MRRKKIKSMVVAILFSLVCITGSIFCNEEDAGGGDTCPDSDGDTVCDINDLDPDDPDVAIRVAEASLLTLAAGESVSYAGFNPAGNDTMTLVFNGDGSFEKHYTVETQPGNFTGTGTWTYDGYQMTLYHETPVLGPVVIEMTEVYSQVFVYENSNKLDLYAGTLTAGSVGGIDTFVSSTSTTSIQGFCDFPPLIDMDFTMTNTTEVVFNDDSTLTVTLTTVITGYGPGFEEGTSVVTETLDAEGVGLILSYGDVYFSPGPEELIMEKQVK